MKKFIVFFSVILFLFGCAPKEFKPFVINDGISFKKEKPYVLNLDNIQKPSKLKTFFLDENYKLCDINEAKYVAMAPKEYNKIAQLLILTKTYKNIAKEQAKLINVEINKNNALKEYIMLDVQKIKYYRELWANSENAYRQERYDHQMDERINKISQTGIIFGLIVALIIAI